MFPKIKKVTVQVMSIKHYTNEEVLKKFVESVLVLYSERGVSPCKDRFWLAEYERLKEEILERMEK